MQKDIEVNEFTDKYMSMSHTYMYIYEHVYVDVYLDAVSVLALSSGRDTRKGRRCVTILNMCLYLYICTFMCVNIYADTCMYIIYTHEDVFSDRDSALFQEICKG